ncbi:MFS transporter [Paucibacter sp. R3-3]|uniref:MFS transporter n=1 Tax=Roseateles agri TaxID=3098619 RepID=A0ABU5DF74_9BURK|nr:MFS transporter [Paucibacter sp. R3-3]MDY0744423.1 MFS transporter [Paucibacter sp. R3-3]
MSSSPSFQDLLRQREYIRFWCARTGWTLGSQMLMVAIGWQMYDLTSSAWDLGLVGLFQFAPALLLTLVAGHVADVFHRGRIVGLCLLLQTIAAALLVSAIVEHWASRELLLAVSVLLGMARAFQQPAAQALTPMLLPPALIPQGMAFATAGSQVVTIAGPALGGLLYVAGATAVYLVCALIFGAAAALMLRVRYERVARTAEPVSLKTIFAGVAFVWQRKMILGAVSLDLFAVLLGGATALLPIFAKDILHTGPWGLGLLRGAPAVGALAMSVALTRRPLRRHAGRKLLGAVALFGVATIVFGLSSSFWISLVALAVSGAADTVSVVIRQTLVQLETPDAMRGRVSAVTSIFIGASNQLGEFESGATAALFGPVGSVVLGGIGTIVVAGTWAWRFREMAQRDQLVRAA